MKITKSKKSLVAHLVSGFFVFPLLIAFSFSGCASIPEPSEKKSTLVYAIADYYGTYQYAGNPIPETVNKKSGIKLVIRNPNTKRSYTAVSSQKGEIIMTNVPAGYYMIKEISAEYTYDERNWWTKITPDSNNLSTRFYVKDGVTNLGHIRLYSNYSGGSGSAYWGESFEKARNVFSENHSDSSWNFEDWHIFSGIRQ